MGADQSKLGESSTIKHAFNVLRVDEHSPAARAKLHPYFDYIVSVNGVEIVRRATRTSLLLTNLLPLS